MKHMKPGAPVLAVLAFLVSLVLPASHAIGLDEPGRLWLVGERAFADGLYPLARSVLERFVADFPGDPRMPEATFILGKTRLALGEPEAALLLLRRVQTVDPPPPWRVDARFWEGEALFRLKNYTEARAAYDDLLRTNAASPLAADALYGMAFADVELGQRARGADEFGEFLRTWPQHPLVPSATYNQARVLIDLKRSPEAVALLSNFETRFPNHKLAPDAAYLLGVARVQSGDTKAGIADLRAFVSANPSHPQTGAAQKVIKETLGRPGSKEELAASHKTLMADRSPTPEGYAEAANAARLLGRSADQEAAWRKLRATFPEHPLGRQAALELANRAFARNDWKEAATLAQAASADPTLRPEALLLAGESELKLKRYPAALKAFSGVTASEAVEPKVRYRAVAGSGIAYEAQEQWRPALTAYEAVAERSPDPTLRNWARARAAEVRPHIDKPPETEKATPKAAPKSGSKSDPKPGAKPPPKSGGGS
jgi:TolA-binding protein